MPVGSFVAGVLGKELGPPAKNVRAEDRSYPAGDLWVTDMLGEQIDIQMPVVVDDIRLRGRGDRAIQRICGMRTVERLAPDGSPYLVHLVRSINFQWAYVPVLAEEGKLLGGERWEVLLHAHCHFRQP